MYLKYILICICVFLSLACQAQVSKSAAKSSGNARLNEVSRAIEQGKPDKEVAKGYEKLAKELIEKEDYSKAEDYLTRAKKLYEKLKDKEKIAELERELAKVQESQNKLNEAIVSFSNAQINTKDKKMQRVNAFDMQRVANQNNPQKQSYFIQEKLDILNETENREDKVLALQQMAQVNKELNNAPEAIKNLERALVTAQDEPTVALGIRKEIANTYADNDQIEEAIKINKDLVAEAKKTNNSKAEIEQLQTLSSNYLKANKQGEGITTLKQAYDLAINQGQTLDAKNSLEMLVKQYKKTKQPQKAMEAYAHFISRLDTLVRNDSTLIDEKFFQIQESKIIQLEKERALKDELISRTNTANYILIGAVILAFIFLFFIVRTLNSIKKKNKRIALQSLRREMNPHFIFNSLNSVNQFIAQNNELEANKYLSSYSKLMRNMMENSNKDFIPLAIEMEQIKEYLDLEYMRFHDKFKYIIDIDESLDMDSVYIPNMLIQPQLENAIWHGLRYKENRGLLSLTIKPDKEYILVITEDNGIGLTKSKALKTKHQKEHNSRGLTNTRERINLLNSLYNTHISIEIIEKSDGETGVIVILRFPLLEKKI